MFIQPLAFLCQVRVAQQPGLLARRNGTGPAPQCGIGSGAIVGSAGLKQPP